MSPSIKYLIVFFLVFFPSILLIERASVFIKQKRIRKSFRTIAARNGGVLTPDTSDRKYYYQFPRLGIVYKNTPMNIGVYWHKSGGHCSGRFLSIEIPVEGSGPNTEKSDIVLIVTNQIARSGVFLRGILPTQEALFKSRLKKVPIDTQGEVLMFMSDQSLESVMLTSILRDNVLRLAKKYKEVDLIFGSTLFGKEVGRRIFCRVNGIPDGVNDIELACRIVSDIDELYYRK